MGNRTDRSRSSQRPSGGPLDGLEVQGSSKKAWFLEEGIPRIVHGLMEEFIKMSDTNLPFNFKYDFTGKAT